MSTKINRDTRKRALSVLLTLVVVLSTTAGLAGAATTTDLTVSITDNDDTIAPGETTTAEIAVSSADGGVAAAELGVELSEPGVATITDVSVLHDPGATDNEVAGDGQSADVKYAFADSPDTGSVTILEVTIQATSAGSTDINIGENSNTGNLVVGDEGGDGYTLDTVGSATLTVGTSNGAPTAAAGDDQTVAAGAQVTLDASGSSDPDGDDLTYSWTQTDGLSVDLSDADTATPTFTAPDVDSETTLTFEVEVTDGNGGTDTDTVNVTVTPVDDTAPTVTNFGLTNPDGQTLEVAFDSDETLAEISVEITDDNGDTVTTLGTDDFSSSDGTYTATYEAGSPGTYTATLVTAADEAGNDGATGQSDSATIGAPNSDPTAAFTTSPETPIPGQEVTFDASGSSDDGSIAGYAWEFGDGASGSGATTTHTYDSAGEYDVTLTVTDDDGATDMTTQTVTVADDSAPEIGVEPTSLDFGSVTVDGTATETVTVTNDGDATLSVSTTDVTGADASAFSVADGGAPFELAPGETHTVTVAFAPGDAGSHTASLELDSDDPDESTVTVGLAGEGTEGEPTENTLRVAGDGDYAFYALRASGDITGSSLTGEDSISGQSAAGAVAGGSDTYTFSGDLENLYVGEDATVFLNGEQINPDGYESVLRVEGSGEYSSYDFTVQDGTITDSAGLTGEDSVSDQNASGAVAGGSDEYTLTGSFRGLDTDGDASLVLNGIEVPPRVFYNTITFAGTGSLSTYEFTVTGEVQSTMGLTGEDSFADDHASGAVRGGSDTYVYSGVITDLNDSGDTGSSVMHNGASTAEKNA